MTTTDVRSGFRLPWSSEQRPPADDGSPTPEQPAAAGEDAGPATAGPATATPEAAARPSNDPGATAAGGRRPTKFLADLTRAMQTAAEQAREETLARLAGEAKTHIEEIHARSATESNDLRRQSDDDVTAIREWSKAEIARIREETETRIGDRKGRLEIEIQEHAGLVERQIERVQTRVAAFETEMAEFFERLLAEENPTRFAAMAQNLPDPPTFDMSDWDALRAEAARGSEPEPEATEVETPDAEAEMAAIQAAAEAAEAAARSESGGWDAPAYGPGFQAEPAGGGWDGPATAGGWDGRSDLAAAEAEAFAAADSGTEEVDIPTIGDEALAARLAVLVPNAPGQPSHDEGTTQVVVTGLVSVASIASFKRQVGRLSGVHSVGVSSGPDGEFVFAVAHGPGVNLEAAVPSLPGFQARVTGSAPGVIEVIAHDPESDG